MISHVRTAQKSAFSKKNLLSDSHQKPPKASYTENTKKMQSIEKHAFSSPTTQGMSNSTKNCHCIQIISNKR